MNSHNRDFEPFPGLAAAMDAHALTAAIAAGDVLSRVLLAESSGSEDRERTASSRRSSVTLARLYLRQGHIHEARAVLREILERNPTDADAQIELGRLSTLPRKLRAADLVADYGDQQPGTVNDSALRLALLRELLRRLQSLN